VPWLRRGKRRRLPRTWSMSSLPTMVPSLLGFPKQLMLVPSQRFPLRLNLLRRGSLFFRLTKRLRPMLLKSWKQSTLPLRTGYHSWMTTKMRRPLACLKMEERLVG
jgi:hypothetical protein